MANPSVTVEINGKDNLSPKLKQIGANLSEIGGKMSMAFTAPLIGLGVAIAKFGQDTEKAVSDIEIAYTDAQRNLQDAIANGQKSMKDGIIPDSALEKIAEARNELAKTKAAFDNIPESSRRAADAWREMQDALAPVSIKLDETKTALLEIGARVVKDLAPSLLVAADAIKKMVDSFIALPVSTQNFILQMMGLVIAAGPVIFTIGQIITTVGTLGELFVKVGPLFTGITTFAKGLVIAFGAISLPVWGLIAAITALIGLIVSGEAAKAWRTLEMLVGIGMYKLGLISAGQLAQNMSPEKKAAGGPVTGGSPYIVGERGPELFVPNASGSIIPNHQMASAGGVSVILNYAPTLSTASRDEIERIGRIISDTLRRQP